MRGSRVFVLVELGRRSWADLTVREVQLLHEKELGDLRAASWEAARARRRLEGER